MREVLKRQKKTDRQVKKERKQIARETMMRSVAQEELGKELLDRRRTKKQERKKRWQ